MLAKLSLPSLTLKTGFGLWALACDEIKPIHIDNDAFAANVFQKDFAERDCSCRAYYPDHHVHGKDLNITCFTALILI